MAETTLIDKPAPVKPMSPVAPSAPNPVGGKIVINDGTSRRVAGEDGGAKKDKPKEGAEAVKAEDDLKSGLEALRERLGLKKKEDKKPAEDEAAKKAAADKVKADAEKAEADKKSSAAAGDEGGDKPKEGKVTKKAKSAVTPEMIDDVARRAAKVALDAAESTKPKETPKAGEDAELSAHDKRDYEVFKFLEGQSDNYKGISKQFLKFTKDFEAYKGEWEKENPDKEFDPQDESHDQFYAKNQPQYDPDDFENAKIEMRVESKLKEKEKALSEKYDSIEADVIEQKMAPEVGRRIGESVHEMVKAVDPEAAKLILEKGSEAFADADPIGFEALDRAASELGSALTELEKLTHPSGKFKFKPDNKVHAWIDQFATNLEQQIKSLSLEDQIRDGRMFASAGEIRQMPEAQRGRYWVLDLPTIRGELVRFYSDGAKRVIASEKKKLAAYQAKYGGGTAKTPDGDDGKGGAAGGKVEKPNSPAAALDAGAASAGKVENNSQGSAISALVTKLFPS